MCKLSGYKYNPRNTNAFREKWYANNNLIRYEFPIAEGDSGVCQIHHMLHTLCENRKIPDMDFFINRRDFPLLKSDNTEPYTGIFGKSHPLVSHKYDKYAPILSMVNHIEYDDVAIPTWDDWSRVCENQYFPKSHSIIDKSFSSIKWEDKKPIAVFRGGSTGDGTTIATNIRLKASFLSWKHRDDETRLLDAGITKWNTRPRLCNMTLETIDHTAFPFGLVNELTPIEQSQYKYILHLPGHVEAFRLSLEMGMGCVILLPKCSYNLWFQKYLSPYKHYIPISEDLSDLFEKIQYCKDNDSRCKAISKNCRDFYDKYLSKDGMLDFFQYTLVNIKRKMGTPLYSKHILTKFEFKKQVTCLKSSIIDIPELNDLNLLKDKEGKVIYRATYNGDPVIHKLIDNKSKKTTEAFMGKYIVNNIDIPNFAKTYGITTNGIVVEYIEGVNFLDYLKSATDIEEFLKILCCILLSIQYALENHRFVHYDLYPWNIVLKPLDRYETQTFALKSGDVTISSKYIPIIIDFGRSSGVYDNYHYNSGGFSTIQDTLTILISSVNVISSKHLGMNQFRKILRLVNFLKNTKYLRQYISKGIITNSRDLRKFTNQRKEI